MTVLVKIERRFSKVLQEHNEKLINSIFGEGVPGPISNDVIENIMFLEDFMDEFAKHLEAYRHLHGYYNTLAFVEGGHTHLLIQQDDGVKVHVPKPVIIETEVNNEQNS